MEQEVSLIQMLDAPGAQGLAPAGAAGGLWQAAGLLYHEHCGPGQGFASHPPGLCRGRQLLERQFLRCGIKPLKIDLSKAVTGPEAFYVLDAEPLTIKKLTTLVEDASPLGRLFDMDVLRPDGKKVDREELHLEGRKCLICGRGLPRCAAAAGCIP